MDSAWNASTYTWDSVIVAPRGTQNIVTGPPIITDSTITINIDTGVVRKWATAVFDTSVKNNGFLLKPANISGALSVYSNLSSYLPSFTAACTINGVPDTVASTSSYNASVAHTTITTMVPSGPYSIVQSGTGLREKILFALDTIPNFSIINYAQLTVFADPLDTLYSGNSADSLYAYYIINSSTDSVLSPYLSTQVGNKYTFSVTIPVQQMVNTGNYGFLITRADEITNVDARFIYNESAPDSLKPRLTITYSPVVKKSGK